MSQQKTAKKFILKAFITAAAACTAVTVPSVANAASFGFDFTFTNGTGAPDSIVGTIEGTEVNPGVVSNLTNLNATFRGIPFSSTPSTLSGFFTLDTVTPQQYSILLTPSNTSPFLSLNGFTNLGVLLGFNPNAPLFDTFVGGNGTFSAFKESSPVIPTPALLPGLIACGIGAIKKRRQDENQDAT